MEVEELENIPAEDLKYMLEEGNKYKKKLREIRDVLNSFEVFGDYTSKDYQDKMGRISEVLDSVSI